MLLTSLLILIMPIYTYETIPLKKGQKSRRFEVEQPMSDDPLKKDPKTGLPVKRVITGGSGLSLIHI